MSRVKDLQKYIHKLLSKSSDDPKEFANGLRIFMALLWLLP